MFISEGYCSLNRCWSSGQCSLQCGTQGHVLLFMVPFDGHVADCLWHGVPGLTGATINTDCGTTGPLKIFPGLLVGKYIDPQALCPYCWLCGFGQHTNSKFRFLFCTTCFGRTYWSSSENTGRKGKVLQKNPLLPPSLPSFLPYSRNVIHRNISNSFAEYNKQDAAFHSFFITLRRSTCFRRVFRP